MPRPLRMIATVAALTLVVAGLAVAHDMFLKPTRFFVEPGATLDLLLLNGNFTNSENSIARNRLLDVSVLGPSGRVRVDTAQWSVAGDTSSFSVPVGVAGTWQLGVSTRPNIIPLTGAEFNEYLASDGIPDVLAARKRDGELERGVRERYHKHVKALVQVGDTRSEQFSATLGYPAELVPLENPYTLRPGSVLRFRALVDGTPVANQHVQYGGRTASGGRIEMRAVRTDAQGVGQVRLSDAGTWYLMFISMTRLTGDSEADYESKWASLTFAIR